MQDFALSTLPVALWLPALVLATTCFLRVTILLSALRAGLGAERLLPGSVMATLGFLVSFVVMYPVAQEIMVTWPGAASGDLPLDPWRSTANVSALQSGLQPLWDFMQRQASASEIEFFADLQGLAATHPMVVVPSFLVSELLSALRGALVILLPFWLFDLLGAQAIALLNWQIAPTYLTLPAKLLFFQAIDGWHLIVGAIYDSYH